MEKKRTRSSHSKVFFYALSSTSFFNFPQNICDLPHEHVSYEQMHSKQMDEKWIAKPFETECPNRWQKFLHGWAWMDDKNFWTNPVKWVQSWRKFLNGCSRTDECLPKIFELMRSNRWRKFLNRWGWARMKFLVVLGKQAAFNVEP